MKELDNIPTNPLWCECGLCEAVRTVTKRKPVHTVQKKNCNERTVGKRRH